MKRVQLITLVLALMALLGVACDQSYEGDPIENLAPLIYLSSAPPEGAPNISYKIELHWNGYDPDGRVDHFEYLITDDEVTGSLLIDEDIYETLDTILDLDPVTGFNADSTQGWVEIEEHQGTFLVTADSIPNPEIDPDDDQYMYGENRFLFRAQHTFFLRAVDEHGKHSEIPEHVTFTATTIAPAVNIDQPESTGSETGWQSLPQDIFFHWTGRDSIGGGSDIVIDPVATRWAKLNGGEFGIAGMLEGSMLALPSEGEESIWTDWLEWDEENPNDPDDAGTRTLLRGLDTSGGGGSGQYLFLVQAMDEAGAVTSHFVDGDNLKKIQVTAALQPHFTIREASLGVRFTDHNAAYDMNVAEGQELNLEWEADASAYGSRIQGYRFGWDIIDTSNDSEWSNWSLSHTSSSATFNSGTHVFYVEAQDYSGIKTRLTFRFFIVPFTMENDLLVIDDYFNANDDAGPTTSGWPEGDESTWQEYYLTSGLMNERWRQILSEYPGYVHGRDLIRITTAVPIAPFQTVATYAHVIWEVRENLDRKTALGSVARFVDPYSNATIPYDYVSAYLARGGQMLLCGNEPGMALIPKSDDMPAGDYIDPDYYRKFPFIFTKYLKYSSEAPPSQSETAVKNFILKKHFGIESITRPVDSASRQSSEGLPGASYPIFKTNFASWGMTHARWLPDAAEFAAHGINPPTFDIAPGDSLFFSPRIYQWFEDAGEELVNPNWYDDPTGAVHTEFGLPFSEIYDWIWCHETFTPPVNAQVDAYIPLLGYVPADSTCRFGMDPAEVHVSVIQGQHRNELRYSVPGETDHVTGLISVKNPSKPSVLIGFSPYFLEYDTANNLIDYILTEVLKIDE